MIIKFLALAALLVIIWCVAEWIYSLANQTPEEYREIKEEVLKEWEEM